MWDFKLVVIAETESPDSAAKGRWYHYVIANQITEISGKRRGSKREVVNYVEGCIQRLNDRFKAQPARAN